MVKHRAQPVAKLLAAAFRARDGGRPMQTRSAIESNVATVERFFDATHSGNLGAIDETVSKNIVTHGFPGGNPLNRKQYKQWFVMFGRSFSNMDFERRIVAADDEYVIVQWSVSVDHTGTYAGIVPTGKRISFGGAAHYRMAHGRIAETWLYVDEISILRQISTVPEAHAA